MPRGLDKLTKERRSWNMSQIKGKNTTPELIVRRLLHKMGYRFRLHVRIPIPIEDGRQKSEVRDPKSARRPPTSAIGFQTSGSRRRSVSVDIVLPKYKTAA